MACVAAHRTAREARARWPGLMELQALTRGRFALHSQTVQQVFRAFLANVDVTREQRAAGRLEMRYP